MESIVKKVQYYETDMMGITHHANYIRWMEEARTHFLERIGFPYDALEKRGFLSPVRALSCKYLRPCTFGDEIRIAIAVAAFNGVVLTFSYDMRNAATGEQVCEAASEHVFVKKDGGIVRLKRDLPDFSAALEARVE